MKKLIFILIFNISILLAVENENSEYQFTLYPEFVGLGAMPSISLEYNFNNYALRVGFGRIDNETPTYPVAIYRVFGKNRNRVELGTGLFIADGGPANCGKAVVVAIHWRKESNSRRMFRRVGINLGMLEIGFPLIMPTLGWGIKF